MTGPLRLDIDAATRIRADRRLDERFAEFHALHPEVYVELVKRTREALAAAPGRRVGIRMVWERMRWHFHVNGGLDGFKLNDGLTSRYSRLIMAQEPDLAGVFETRELRSATPRSLAA